MLKQNIFENIGFYGLIIFCFDLSYGLIFADLCVFYALIKRDVVLERHLFLGEIFMKRIIENQLAGWKNAPRRKPLLVRGARQVGKTYSIRELGRTFEHFVEVNFELDKEVGSFFSGSLDPEPICKRLGAFYGESIVAGKTLLFLDEVQACPDALRSLRFFYEKMPELHVVAAGSLLEFALSELSSFGVGRIESLYLYPMSFLEFLLVTGNESLVEMTRETSPGNPLEEPLHKRMVDLVRTFQLIGGFPEIVSHYVQTQDLLECHTLLDDLLATIRDDFAKYRGRISSSRLEEVFQSIAMQSGAKFKYSNVHPDLSSAQGKQALDLLILAGLAHKIIHSDAQGLPLGGQVNPKRFKVIPCDTGLYQRLSGLALPPQLVEPDSSFVNAGAVAEVFVGTELLANANPRIRRQLHYWHREQRGSNAETDYVIQLENSVVPIEVKSGTRGSMQSMRMFLDTHPAPYGIRTALEPFAQYDKIQVVPLYALWRLPEP